MARLLHIEGSPRKQRSHSLSVARVFLDAWHKANPSGGIVTLDPWSMDLPEFNGDMLDAKYAVMHGQSPTPAQEAAWKTVHGVFDRFNAADKYLISLPMWNFGVPYKLKQFIDVITQPGMAFTVDDKGYHGQVTGRPVAVIYASGGDYPTGTPGASFDFQKPYIETWLRFVGFTDIRAITVAPTLAGGPEVAAKNRELAATQATEMARQF